MWDGAFFHEVRLINASNQAIEPLLVPPITTNNQPVADKIETLVDRIIDLKKDSQDTSHLENQIDQLVYRLYNLTPEGIGVVEG